MLNANPGGLDPSAARPFQFAGAPNQQQTAPYIGQGNFQGINYATMQGLAPRNGLGGHPVSTGPPPATARFPLGGAGGPLGQFPPAGRGPLAGMNVGPMNGLGAAPAMNRAPINVPALALNAGLPGAGRPTGLDRGISSALNMGLQTPQLQQRAQPAPNIPLGRPINGLNIGAGAPMGNQLNLQMPAGYVLGTSPGRGNPLTMHPGMGGGGGGNTGYAGGHDGLMQTFKGSAAPGTTQLGGIGPGAYGLQAQQQLQQPGVNQLGMQLAAEQGQPGLQNGDGLLQSMNNADLFANMHKAPGLQTEFSIQNEQEFPALPTTTQPREEAIPNHDMQQQSLQVGVGQQAHILARPPHTLHNLPNGDHMAGLPGRPAYAGEAAQPGGLAVRNQDATTVGYQQFQQSQHVQSVDRPQASKLPEAYGVIGLLPVIEARTHEVSTLAMGADLTSLGLPLNSSDRVCKTFGSPWADQAMRPEPEFKVPSCYLHKTLPRLQPGQFTKFQVETLFYIFYSMPGDEAQVYAADELSHRGWTFHKEFKVWLARIPGLEPMEKRGQTSERGSYRVFDLATWEIQQKDNFVLHYDALEQPPLGHRSNSHMPQSHQPPPAGQ